MQRHWWTGLRRATFALALGWAAACGGDRLSEPATAPAAVEVAEAPAVVAKSVSRPDIVIQPAGDTVVAVGKSDTLHTVITLSPGDSHIGNTIVWTSSNTKVLAISGHSTAVITGKAVGTATVTARDLSWTQATLKVRVGAAVTPPPPPPPVVASVSVAPATVSLAVGATQQLTATAKDSTGKVVSGAPISWASSNANASVSASGLVKAVAVGSATVTASSSGHVGTSVVSVTGGQPPPPPPPPPGTWNMPSGFQVVCQTGAVTTMAATSSTVSFGGPVPCTWNKNGGNGSIGLANAATNPDGSANTDVQSSGYRIMLPAGQVNDAAWNMYFNHAGGTGSYYIGWLQRWQPLGSYAALQAAMNSSDSKVWAPKDNKGGDLTIMSWMNGGNENPVVPVIGLNFQGADGHNIPDVNHSGGTGTTPVVAAMVLPGVNGGKGAWDQQEILITGNGTLGTSSVCLFVNGGKVGCATSVTTASAWTATEQYLSRSIYSGVQGKTVYTDLDQVTVAVK